MRVWPLVMVPLLAMAACGGGGDADTTATTSAPTTAATGPTQVAGTPDPLAITAFTCARGAKGAWRVKGTLENTAAKARNYRVTVFIGEQAGPARVLALDNVQPDQSVPFALDPIVASPDGPCRIQALVPSA